MGHFMGLVAADEPEAVLVGRQVLASGGNAADAAVALALALTVTLPSRAGLGGGGACLAYDPSSSGPGDGAPEAILFLPKAPAAPRPRSDRPAAVPMMARGLYLLLARYGTQQFDELLQPVIAMARDGGPVSAALAADLAVVARSLLTDPNARAVFAGPDGHVLHEGQRLIQPDLATTLSTLVVAGVGDLYQGELARRLAAASAIAGGGLRRSDFLAALPRLASPLVLPAGNDSVAFLPPPADGGLAAAAAFRVLSYDPLGLAEAATRGLAAAAVWREQGGNPAALISASLAQASLLALPASTGFVVLDRTGMAVSCVLTMDNLFGTGRVAPGTGILLAASPAAKPLPLLAAAITWNRHIHAFRAAVAASGQLGAGTAVAVAMHNALAAKKPMPVEVPDPGRANVIACSRYLPGARSSCAAATDPRGYGLALSGF